VAQRLQASGFADVLEGTVYPALTRLEREGRLATRLVPSPSGPARKYYRLTPAGREALTAAGALWARHVAGVEAVLSRPLPADHEEGP
jgi:PadR family transcriptional regulator PadR